MPENDKQKNNELRNLLIFERKIVYETKENLKNLEAEHLDDDEYYEYKRIYEKAIEEHARRIKELEDQYANMNKIPFIESEIEHQEADKEKISKEIEWRNAELSYKRYIMNQKQKDVHMLQESIKSYQNDIENLIIEIRELEFINNETVNKISTLKKEVTLAKEIVNTGGLKL